jgi:anti-sigma B factor antagonist
MLRTKSTSPLYAIQCYNSQRKELGSIIMDIQVTEIKGVHLIQPTGRLDSENSPALAAAFDTALDAGHSQLVLALDHVEYISSAGLRAIVNAFKRARDMDGDLRLANPSERVESVLALAGLDKTLAIYPRDVAAVESYQ